MDQTVKVKGTKRSVVLTKQQARTAKTVLTRAYKLLKNAGWCKGEEFDGQKYCAIGAISKAATGSYGNSISFMHPASQVLRANTNYSSIPAWNDTRSRKWRDVSNTFRKSITQVTKALTNGKR